FGRLIGGEFSGPDAVAAAIDRQIIDLYTLHPTNFFAYRRLHGSYPQLPCGVAQAMFNAPDHVRLEQDFTRRIDALPEAHRPYALAIYANPIVSKLEQQTNSISATAC
ncbi:MAG TPA: cytochrome C oxidase Cbb3, partial [Spongiibacteraceae bacterium]|nr:cytochrome C oxidase Cbb3 [Spongiibacteraceae bacterium]